MAVSTAFPGVILPTGETRRTAAPPSPATRPGLLARCGGWLRRRSDAARLREMDPHLARDIGVAPACGPCPEGFAVDPRPLWGIGLTPQPMAPHSPRAERRRGG
jgi:uncharacterized protein YjiS (DUF1127 family)